MEKRLICVSCPLGCEITVGIKGGKVARIEGNRCRQGETYARQEAVDPMRTIPTNVKVLAGEQPLVSVKTDRPVPKRLISRIMEVVRTLEAEAPIEIGQVIAEDLLETGANLVATRSVDRYNSST